METTENDLSPQQSLALIESMINRAKDKFAEDGSMYLFWGWLVFVCSLVQFILLHVVEYPKHYIVWLATFPAFVYQVFYIRKKRKQQTVTTYTGYIIGYIWLTFCVVMVLIGFLIGFLTGGDYYYHIIPLLLAIYGVPVFLTGIIIRFRSLVTGGIACWFLCIASTFIKNYDYQFLMLPASMLIAWIIPGYMLRSKYKSE